ncbi:FRG domain-containing protein [Shewanella nanhaiensis]|uniref:FRG domain-containing protein n=1 Tax=Shewanella nanhaiensis TaxID=2864872 RepID=A0ABS7DZW8_9GAMM|nr:FRG domain-containing protein [Shewanella nanhaiensis]MBW8182914.1 FRG domain-containing protein [Shewanella nanhaiensis]
MNEELEDFWSEFNLLLSHNSGASELLFRGVSNKSYKLIPSIGRGTENGTGGIFHLWKGI